MKSLIPLALLALSPLSLQAAELTLEWRHPDSYRDIRAPGDHSTADYRQRVFDELGAELRRLASGLPARQRLELVVIDLDLAGELKHRGNMAYPGVRVETTDGRYPPRMQIEYRLLDADGSVLAAGDDRLEGSRMPGSRSPAGQRRKAFESEKQMLEGWFRERFGQH